MVSLHFYEKNMVEVFCNSFKSYFVKPLAFTAAKGYENQNKYENL